MGKEDNHKGGDDMAILARPGNGIITIDKNKSGKFFEDSKKNTIKPEFLKRCQKFAKMMKGDSK